MVRARRRRARRAQLWIDIYPLHKSIQVFRYGALLQFGLLLAASVGIALAMRLMARAAVAEPALAALPLIALVVPAGAPWSYVVAAGVGLAAFALRGLPERQYFRAACVAVAAGALALPVRTGGAQLSVCFRTLPDAPQATATPLTSRLVGWLQGLPRGGYAGWGPGRAATFTGGCSPTTRSGPAGRATA